jgi:Zn-finger nucleic acid-binding protein
MKCPRCPGGPQLKIEHYEGVEIDRCAQCHGVWLDEGELLRVVNAREAPISSEHLTQALQAASTGIPSGEHQTVEHCPKCAKPLTPMNYTYSSGIILDRCPALHGVWLDGKEIEKVQAHAEHWESEASKKQQAWSSLARDAKAQAELERAQGVRAGSRLFRLLSKYL